MPEKSIERISGARCRVCLQDMARTGKPRQYDTNVEAQITALACYEPPAGAKHWTLDLLELAARAQDRIGPISRKTIRRRLKKLPQILAKADVVRRPTDASVAKADVRSARSRRSCDPTNRLFALTRKASNCSRTRVRPANSPGMPVRQDCEYVRSGTDNLFVAVEAKGGRRTVTITDHRANLDLWVFYTSARQSASVSRRNRRLP